MTGMMNTNAETNRIISSSKNPGTPPNPRILMACLLSPMWFIMVELSCPLVAGTHE
jgi:hypothetical protein